MRKTSVQALWNAHRAIGVLLGVLIFVLFVTGTTSVFRDELRLWSSPAVQAGPGRGAATLDGASVQRAIEVFAEHHPLEKLDRAAMFLPLYEDGLFELLYQEPGRKRLTRSFVRGGDFAYLGAGTRFPGEFLFNIHANLTIRSKPGRLTVGLVGLACLFLVLSGILMHRHKLRNAFTFRGLSSLRRGLGDAHRALGLWGLPFFLVISLSGAALGLKSLLVVLPTAVEFQGNLAEAKKALRPPRVSRAGQVASMLPVAELWQASLELAKEETEGEADCVPTFLNLWAWGDTNAQWSLGASLPGALAPQNEGLVVRLSARSGERISVENTREQGWPHRSFSALSPLHYGDFGGWPLKFLYASMGLGGALLVASGLLIWAQRKKDPRTSP